MDNQLYRRVTRHKAYECDAGTVVGACVTKEVNGYAVWHITAAGDGESFDHALERFPVHSREDALELAATMCLRARGLLP